MARRSFVRIRTEKINKSLRNKIFEYKNIRKLLEKIIHPIVKEKE